jgi:hypothetical protein
MKQNKYNDLEVSDFPKENAKVDELARHVYYTTKAIKRLTLSEAKSSVPFPPTGSFINEQSVNMPNLLYNLFSLVLTEDQSDRPISDLEVEMSVATNMHVVSFAQDLIYDVTRCKDQTPERVGLVVLLKNLTGSAEQAKVRQTLCRVSDRSNIPNGILLDVNNFLYAVYAFPSIGDINEVRFLLF